MVFQRAREIGFRASRQGFQLGERLWLPLDDEIEQSAVFVRQDAREAFEGGEPQLGRVGPGLQLAARNRHGAGFNAVVRCYADAQDFHGITGGSGDVRFR